MATSSLGKLDAICAKLKSSQLSANDTSSSDGDAISDGRSVTSTTGSDHGVVPGRLEPKQGGHQPEASGSVVKDGTSCNQRDHPHDVSGHDVGGRKCGQEVDASTKGKKTSGDEDAAALSAKTTVIANGSPEVSHDGGERINEMHHQMDNDGKECAESTVAALVTVNGFQKKQDVNLEDDKVLKTEESLTAAVSETCNDEKHNECNVHASNMLKNNNNNNNNNNNSKTQDFNEKNAADVSEGFSSSLAKSECVNGNNKMASLSLPLPPSSSSSMSSSPSSLPPQNQVACLTKDSVSLDEKPAVSGDHQSLSASSSKEVLPKPSSSSSPSSLSLSSSTSTSTIAQCPSTTLCTPSTLPTLSTSLPSPSKPFIPSSSIKNSSNENGDGHKHRLSQEGSSDQKQVASSTTTPTMSTSTDTSSPAPKLKQDVAGDNDLDLDHSLTNLTSATGDVTVTHSHLNGDDDRNTQNNSNAISGVCTSPVSRSDKEVCWTQGLSTDCECVNEDGIIKAAGEGQSQSPTACHEQSIRIKSPLNPNACDCLDQTSSTNSKPSGRGEIIAPKSSSQSESSTIRPTPSSSVFSSPQPKSKTVTPKTENLNNNNDSGYDDPAIAPSSLVPRPEIPLSKNSTLRVTPTPTASALPLSTGSSGRRSRRKAAKPQKQVGGRYYSSSEYLLEDDPSCISMSDSVLSGNSLVEVDHHPPFPNDVQDEPNPSITAGSGDFAAHHPLDLSSAQFSNPTDVMEDHIGSKEGERGNSKATGTKRKFEDDGQNFARTAATSTTGKAGERPRMTRTASGQDPMTPSATDTNRVLADYAENTMTELLGIYGFEGADLARNLSLGVAMPIPNFPSSPSPKHDTEDACGAGAALSQREAARDSPAAAAAAASTAAGSSRAKKLGSGPFVKKVYTSLTTPSSVKEVSKAGFRLQVPSLPLAVGTARAPTVLSSSGRLMTNGKAPANGDSGSSSGGGTGSVSASTVSVPRKNYTAKALSSADFHKYIRRYGNGLDCGGEHCRDLGYRDHYHCLDCPHKVFIRKEEMVRHFKWHKKRQESLQHGFMRYSPMDDCGKRFGSCAHNGRQTHYHCVQRGCDKVYISTSDVQMHANFHRKDSAIIQEGFQRFRATEDCGTTSCAFYGHRTTHFHCRRPQCNFTFKNKSDMEKHKSYHQKDQVLAKDGFKKFMKYEPCPYSGCRYSKSSNHIHCIRPGCQYVLHSTAQLYSHKRKHERREFENAYRSYRQLQHPPATNSMAAKSRANGPQAATSNVISNSNSNSNNDDDDVSTSDVTNASGNKAKFVSIPSAGSPAQQDVAATSQQVPSSIRALQGIPLDSKITSSLKAASPAFQRGLSVSPEREEEAASALNLSSHQRQALMAHYYHRLGKGTGKEKGEADRSTMALPLALMSHLIKSEPRGVETDEESCEAEDLSVNSRKRGRAGEVDDQGSLGSELSAKKFVIIKGEELAAMEPPSSNDNLEGHRQPDEAMSGVDEEDEDSDDNVVDNEDDDDDDDEDDDDRDYGQVEEPTLVNNVDVSGGSGENEKKPASSHPLSGLPMAAVKREKPEVSAMLQASKMTAVKPEPAMNLKTEQGAPAMKLEEGQSMGTYADLPSPSLAKRLLNAIPAMPLKAKERDESWRKYLIRFTANDACFSRCVCLYKDHYHCRVEGCQVVFKSKDGVRGHARFHEHQDSIRPLVYSKFDVQTACNRDDCQYSEKEIHYHCNWTNCRQIIPESGPTFALLEHYRIHEAGMNAFNKGHHPTKLNSSSPATLPPSIRELDPLQKRRGRPPKYPREDLPFVPKVHLTEKEIMDSTLAFMHNKKYDGEEEESRIVNGFKKFAAAELCPDDNCMFRGRDHYHCGRKFCHMSTDRLDFLTLHSKDFHNNVTILEGYEFFERNVNCRRPHCANNQANRHYHCMRPRCDYSFVRHSTMVQHNRKHPTAPAAVLTPPGATLPPSSSSSQPFTNRKSGVGYHQQFVAIAPAAMSSLPTVPAVSRSSPTISAATALSPNTITSPSSDNGKSKSSVENLTGEKIASSGKALNNNVNPVIGKTIVKSSGTYFPLSGLSKIQLVTSAGIPIQPDSPKKNIDSGTSVSEVAVSSSAGGNIPVMSASPLTASLVATTPQVIQGAQILQTQNGTSLINTANGMCLALPPNLVGTAGVPASPMLLTPGAVQSSGLQQQPGANATTTLLTGIIPMTNLATSQSPHQLLNIPGTQIIATSQGSLLQHGIGVGGAGSGGVGGSGGGGILGSNLVQVIQNPITVISSGAANTTATLPTSVSAMPGGSGVTAGSSASIAPLALLLQQQQQQLLLQQQLQQQQQQQRVQVSGGGDNTSGGGDSGGGSTSGLMPLSWAHLKRKMHYPLSINCGRPFCKLKKKDHYHCLDCYQAFSDPARLRVHLGKHNFKFKKADSRSRKNKEDKGNGGLQDQIVTKVCEGLDLSAHVKKQVKSHCQDSKSTSAAALSSATLRNEDDIDDESQSNLSSSLNLCPSVFTEMVVKGKEVEALSSLGSSPPHSSELSKAASAAEKITLVMSNVNSRWTISRNEGSKRAESDNTGSRQGDGDQEDEDVSIVAVEQRGRNSAVDNDYDSDPPLLMVDEGQEEEEESNDSSLNTSSSSLTLCSSLSRKSRSRRPSVRRKDYVDSETILEATSSTAPPSKPRRKYNKKDVNVPEGFVHVKCSHDCGYTRCAYRQSVTHFHCLRPNCGYGISDRSRIAQHTARHERLDALMGGEFQHFRASVTCGRPDCEFDERSSHFHCLKCPFSCTDSGRVPAHRKHHAKLDNVSNNGFVKFTGAQDCQTAACYYFRKQTHYHCTFPGCNHAVLGPSQMAPHKLKHAQHSQ